ELGHGREVHAETAHCRPARPAAVRAWPGRCRSRPAPPATTMHAPSPDRAAAMATPPTYLDDAQIARLSDLLEQRAVPFRGFNLEALDGFLSALVVAPSPVPVEEWEPAVWGGKPPRWDSEAEAAEVRELLQGHWNMCAARARHGEG